MTHLGEWPRLQFKPGQYFPMASKLQKEVMEYVALFRKQGITDQQIINFERLTVKRHYEIMILKDKKPIFNKSILGWECPKCKGAYGEKQEAEECTC